MEELITYKNAKIDQILYCVRCLAKYKVTNSNVKEEIQNVTEDIKTYNDIYDEQYKYKEWYLANIQTELLKKLICHLNKFQYAKKIPKKLQKMLTELRFTIHLLQINIENLLGHYETSRTFGHRSSMYKLENEKL